MDMLFSLFKSNSVLLSDIARTLHEPIDIMQTIKKLSSRIEMFHEGDLLYENYKNTIRNHFKAKDNLIIVDNSEVIKSYSNKLKALGYIEKVHRKRVLDD